MDENMRLFTGRVCGLAWAQRAGCREILKSRSPPRQNGDPQIAQVAMKIKSRRPRGMPAKTRMHCLEQSHQLLFF